MSVVQEKHGEHVRSAREQRKHAETERRAVVTREGEPDKVRNFDFGSLKTLSIKKYKLDFGGYRSRPTLLSEKLKSASL